MSFCCPAATIYSGMNPIRIFSRIAGAVRVLVVGTVVLFVVLALGIVVDAWVANQAGPMPGEHVTHIRHYLLPYGGLAALALILWRLALPAAADAVRTVLAGGPLGHFVRHACWAIIWFSIGVALFEWAVHLQEHLFGFFLPP